MKKWFRDVGLLPTPWKHFFKYYWELRFFFVAINGDLLPQHITQYSFTTPKHIFSQKAPGRFARCLVLFHRLWRRPNNKPDIRKCTQKITLHPIIGVSVLTRNNVMLFQCCWILYQPHRLWYNLQPALGQCIIITKSFYRKMKSWTHLFT